MRFHPAEVRDLHLPMEPLPPRNEGDLLKVERKTVIWREREVRPGAAPLVVKVYRHRRWWDGLRSLLFRFRAEREYRRLRHLERGGVAVTPAVGWGFGWTRRDGLHEALVMEEVEGATSLEEWLTARRSGSPDGEARTSRHPDLEPLFRLVRAMHEQGLCSQTLYASNILVTPEGKGRGGLRFVLSDLPRSWVFPRSLVGSRLALWDLLDLVYTLREAGMAPTPEDLAGYGSGWGGGLPGSGLRRKLGTDWNPKRRSRRRRRDLVARALWVLAWGAAPGEIVARTLGHRSR